MDKLVLYAALNWGAGAQRSIISLAHSSTTSYYSFQTLYNMYKDKPYEEILKTSFNNINSYLLIDSLYLLTEKKIKKDMLYHHIVTLILTQIGSRYGQDEASAFILFTSEISTIFLSAKDLTLDPKKKLIYSVLFALCFFAFRFPVTFYYCYKRLKVIKKIPFIGKIFCLCLFLISTVWMKQIATTTFQKVIS
jgi:hypothetical protein